MPGKWKWTVIVIAALAAIGLTTYYLLRIKTKAYSPEETITYLDGALVLKVFYNRPYKKERQIFGGLVPYGTVWRTGANEATTFESNKDLFVDGSLLPAGKYTLWTIPEENSWKIIFNSKMYPWGITTEGKAAREPEYDVLILERPVYPTYTIIEQFTIYFEEAGDLILMKLVWDKTEITVPIKIESDIVTEGNVAQWEEEHLLK